MKRTIALATLGVAAQAFLLGIVAAEEYLPQVKTGIVRKVDTSVKQVVVMAARELTFTVTESTKILQSDEAKKFADITVGAKVTVEYAREGDTRTAKKIAILTGEVLDGHAAKETKPAIKPGNTFTIKFPDMPPTFADMLGHNGLMPMMTVSLPANYDPGRKHPLLIFLNGGNGGSGGNPSVARALSEDKDFVCVSLPLFKEKLDPPAPGNGTSRILIRDADCRYAWPLYKVMLAKLEEQVPNIDPAQRVLGGFSNGAHATAGLVNETDGEVAARFSAFLLVNGGGGLRRFDLLKGKSVLMVCGLWRPKQEPVLAAGVRLIVYRMKKAEHAFPESEYPPVRTWLRNPNSAKLVRASAEEIGGLKPGDKAPAFTLMATDGREYSLAHFAGKSAVALCWYPRAGSEGARTQLSAIQAEMKELSKYRVQVLGITLSKLDDNKALAEKLQLAFPLLSDTQLTVANAYGTVRAMKGPFGPTAERWMVVIDAQGIVRSIEKGEEVENKGKLLLTALEKAQIPKQ